MAKADSSPPVMSPVRVVLSANFNNEGLTTGGDAVSVQGEEQRGKDKCPGAGG